MSNLAIKMFMWPTTAMIVFSGAESPVHEHVTAQLALGVDGAARACLEGQTWQSAPGLLVPQGLRHGYDAREGLHFVLWIEAESAAGDAIRQRFAQDRLTALDAERVAPVLEALDGVWDASFGAEQATAVRDVAVEMLTGAPERPRARVDRHVRRAVELLVEHRDRDLSVADLASMLAVSESHLSHSFREQVGATVARYRMWVRTMEAARLLGTDLSVTEVAHQAGFADSAHLARTFKRLIGQSPSTAQRGSLGVLVIDEPL